MTRPPEPHTPSTLLARLLRRGVELWVEDGELRFRAPKGVVTPELREEVARHRPAIVALLGAAEDPDRPLSEVVAGDRRPASRSRGRLEERGALLEEIEAALLAEHAVEDCAVLPREADDGEVALVAYVVASGAPSPERLGDRLRAKLPGEPLPDAYVPVSTIPLTPVGAVDGAALSRILAIDKGLVRRWEEHLRAHPDVDRVEVLEEDAERRPADLRVDELLPGPLPAARPVATPEAASAAGTPAATAAPVEDTAPASVQDRPVALAGGGRLAIPEGAPRTLTEALERTAAEHPEHGITYVGFDGSETFESYPALLERATRILGGLQGWGLDAGDRAILQLDALEDHYAVFWACVLGGIVPVTVAVPLSYGQRGGVVDKLLSAWELLGCPPILASPGLVEPAAGLAGLVSSDGPEVVSVAKLEEDGATGRLHRGEPDEVAFVQLSSGSTGVPKCIQETHRATVAHANAVRQLDGHTPGVVSLNWMPVDHVGALIMWHLRDTYVGARQVQARTDLILAEPLRWLDLLEAHRVNHTWAPNFAYRLVADRLSTATDRRWDLSSIRFFLNGGEQVTLPVARDFLERVAPFGVSEDAMQPAYGMAETSTRVTARNNFELCSALRLPPGGAAGDGASAGAGFIDLGPPIPGVELRIVNAEDEPLHEGAIGRLQVRGAVVTPGYLHNEAANREALVGDGWFNTGDLGFLLDGRLSLTGREKETIIVRGANLYCHEIEDVVSEVEGVCPTFAGACAVTDHAAATEGFAIFFVPDVGGTEDLGELCRRIRARVAAATGVAPTHVVPVALDDFPKTTSGKIQRAQLRQALEAGRFGDATEGTDGPVDAADTIPDWFYRRAWRRRLPPPQRPRVSTGRKTLVLVDEVGLGASLLTQERRSGRRCVEVEPGTSFEDLGEDRFRVDPADPGDFRRLLDAVARDGVGVEEVVHLWTYRAGADPVPDLDLDGIEAAQTPGALSLLFLLQALAVKRSADQPLRLLVASSCAQPVLADDEVACEHGPLLGLVRTVGREWPWLESGHVDLEGQHLGADGDAVVRELRAIRPEPEVAYRAGRRSVPRLEPVDLRHEGTRPLPLEHGGLYLVTGGLGGLAGEVAGYLLERLEARLLLVGRTPLPDREDGEAGGSADPRIGRLRALEGLAGSVLYRSADVADPVRMAAVVAEAEARWGRPLDGVLHLAGVFEERPLAEETRETLMASLRPKLHGTWTLHEVAGQRPGCAFVTFSSANGTFGGAGAGAYSAANGFLDGFAHRRRLMGLPSSCFAWSLWDAPGMADRLAPAQRRLSRAAGFIPISPPQGVSSLLAGLNHEETHLLVGLDGGRPYVGRHIDRPAEGTRVLRAYVTGDGRGGGSPLTSSEVRDRFGTPSLCEVARVPELPLTETGAVDRTGLRELRRPAGTELAGRRAQRAEPRTPAEVEVATVLADVLGARRVSLDDDLAALGGNALLATRIAGRLRRRFGVELGPRAVLEASTVAGIALALLRAHVEPPASALSSQQRHLWSKEHELGIAGSAHGTRALRLRGRLDAEALESALGEVCARHKALRTTFHPRKEGPVQIVRPPRPVTLVRPDLSGVPSRDREAEARRLLAREAQRPFDLSRDPMLRATLVRMDDEEHLVLLVVHHIACDERSLDILESEMGVLYLAAGAGGGAELPRLLIQYPDYAVWQRERLADGALRESMEFWKSRLAGVPRELEMPTDRPPSSARGSRGAWQEQRVPHDLMAEVRALSRREGATPFMTLMAAWAALLHLYSGQDDIVVFTPYTNRVRPELEGVIGFFASNLFLRHDPSGDPPFSELLERVRRTATDAFARGELTYHELPVELRPKHLVAFLMRGAGGELPTLDGLDVERVEPEIDRGEKWFLALVVEESAAGVTTRLSYDPSLFEAETAGRILRDLRTLLESVVADSGRRLSTLPIVPPAPDRAPPEAAPRRAAKARGPLPRAVRRARKRIRRSRRLVLRTAGRVRARIRTVLG